MDGRGGCCIERYMGGAYDMSKVDRIMLRFRPIAPKPITTAGSISGDSTPKNSDVSTKTGRGKRKYVRDTNNNNNRRHSRRRKGSPEEKNNNGFAAESVVTLPLLPESPERRESPARGSHVDANQPVWLNFNSGSLSVNDQVRSGNGIRGIGSSEQTVFVTTPVSVRIVASCVTVERVTDTWNDGSGLGYTDEERMRNLKVDTCPGFISDGLGRVIWTNEAYRKTVSQGKHEAPGCEMRVWLVMKEDFPAPVGVMPCPAFTCRVRLQYACGKERSSLTLPCDVWRMDGGGFAWRLDVKAALSLGR